MAKKPAKKKPKASARGAAAPGPNRVSTGLRWAIAAITYLGLIALLSPGILHTGFDLAAGDVPRSTLRSPIEYEVLDPEATESARLAAVAEVMPVYTFDTGAAAGMKADVASYFPPEEAAEPPPPPNPLAAQIAALSEDDRLTLQSTAAGILDDLGERGILPDVRDLPDRATPYVILRKGDVEINRDARQITYVDAARSAARQSVRSSLPSPGPLRDICTRLLTEVLRPNLAFDPAETQQRRKAASTNAPQIYYKVQRGEVLAREGIPVSHSDARKIEALSGKLTLRSRLARLAGIAILTMLLAIIVWLYMSHYSVHVLHSTRELMLFGSTLLMMAAAGRAMVTYVSFATLDPGFLIPVAIAAMIITIAMDARVAILVATVIAIFVGVITEYRVETLVVALVGGISSIFCVWRIRRRTVLLRAGLVVGLANTAAILGVTLLRNWPMHEALFNAVAGGLGNGLLCAVITPGLLPIFEHVFGMTTDFRLLELSDLDQPLLKRLANEAPGSYQSSLTVGTLAEAAADAVGANSLLARVGAYYHDIGKLSKPSYFGENQPDAKPAKRHETLTPSMSSLVLISHVKDGVEMARESGLPPAIVDIIRQHHGTTLNYFYQKAKAEDPEGAVKEENFRYPGPRPQTREAAIVSLADSVEAATRSLESPTPRRIREQVLRIINNKFIDGQLDECDLTLRDLTRISECFIRVLTGVYHTRVPYPDDQEEDGERAGGAEERE